MADKLIRFIVNPHSQGGKTGRKWHKMYKKLSGLLDSPSDYKIADGIGTGVSMTKDAIQDGINCIVSVGGEGTNNEVVNGIYQSSNREVTLGFIRSGTVNDYQQIISWPKKIEQQAMIINQNQTVQSPLTKVIGDVERVALNMCDVGVAALAAYKASVKRELTWIKSSFRYTLLALRAVREWENIPATIFADQREITGNLSLLMAGFSTQTGGYKTLPHANILGDDLAYATAMNFSKWQMIRLMGTIKNGKHTEGIEGISMGHAKRIEVDADSPLLFEVDGEPFSYNSNQIIIEAIPNAINIIQPKIST